MRNRISSILLIAFFALSAIAHYLKWDSILQFVISAISVIFVAGFLGKATENVAHYAGQRLGGILECHLRQCCRIDHRHFPRQRGTLRHGQS